MNQPGTFMIGEDLGNLVDNLKTRIDGDLLFACHYLWKLDFLNAVFHRKLANFLGPANPHRKGILAPRGGGKTAEMRAKMAREFLSMADKGLDPRILTISYASPVAKKNITEVVDMIAGHKANHMVAKLYPNIFNKIKNVDVAIESKGVANFNKALGSDHPDATFMAAGLDTGITSVHAKSAYVDDLIDEVASRSPTEQDRALKWFATLPNCLEHQTASPITLIGTHYHPFDTYTTIIDPEKPGGLDLVWFIHSALLTNEYNQMTSYWPEKISVEELLKYQKEAPTEFAALMQQMPIQTEDSYFDEADIQYWEWVPNRKNAIRIVGGDKEEHIFIEDLNIFLIFDPALGGPFQSSEAAIIIVAMDGLERVFVLDYYSEKVGLDKATKEYIRLFDQWKPILAATEEVLFQTLISPGIRQSLPRAALTDMDRLTGVRPRGRNKDVRIMALHPFFTQKRFFMHRSHQKLYQQICTYRPAKTVNERFPVDLLDALGYGPDIWYPARIIPRGLDGGLMIPGAALPNRDSTTGY